MYDSARGSATSTHTTATQGTSISLSAIPNAGYRFVQWQVVSGTAYISNPTAGNISFNMLNSDVTVEAQFEVIPAGEYAVVFQYEGSGSVISTHTTAAEGILVGITAIPDIDYEFDSWEVVSGNILLGDALTETTDFTMPNGDVTILVKFKAIPPPTPHAISLVYDAVHGSATATHTAATQGTSVEISAIPNTGYRFVQWNAISGTVVISNPTAGDTSFIMPDSDIVIEAEFEAIPPGQYAIVFQYDGNGLATSSHATATQGTQVNIAATAGFSYEFVSWEVVSGNASLGDTLAPTTDFTMPDGDVTILVRFIHVPQAPGALTITVTSPLTRNRITPLAGERSTSFDIEISGFVTDGQYVLWLMVQGGLSGEIYTVTPVNGVATRTIILAYNGIAQFNNPQAEIVITNASVLIPPFESFNFTAYTSNTPVPVGTVNVFDGLADFTGAPLHDRRIPVNQANILAFNTYARGEQPLQPGAALSETSAMGRTRHFRMEEDISLAGVNWIPIGVAEGDEELLATPQSTQAFTGSFDGDNRTITGLTLNRPTNTAAGDYTGLFGYLGSSGVIRNLRLTNGTVRGREFVGAVAGFVRGGTIENVHTNNVNVSGNDEVGGLIGMMRQGTTPTNLPLRSTLRYSSSQNGTVSHANPNGIDVCCSGGLVGMIAGRALIERCFSSMEISGRAQVGGLVGRIGDHSFNPGWDNRPTIRDSYSTGNVSIISTVTGTLIHSIGGVVGSNTGGQIINTYATGAVDARAGGETVGGIFGSGLGGTGAEAQFNVALNASIRRESPSALAGRIAASSATSTLQYNYARPGLLIFTGDGITPLALGAGDMLHNQMHGATLSSQFPDQTFYIGTLGWDFTNVWEWSNFSGLPILRGFGDIQQTHIRPSSALLPDSIANATDTVTSGSE
jgi:hypothetical protein